MAKSSRHVAQLEKIIEISQKLLSELSTGKSAKATAKVSAKAASKSGGKKRVRRSGKELQEFRKLLKAERAKGVPVAELAKKHGVSAVYLYTL